MKIDPPEDIYGAVMRAGNQVWVYFDTDSFDDHANLINTVVHESVHVWQHVREYIQEQEPGAEQEAYTIAHITDLLLADVAKHLEKTNCLICETESATTSVNTKNTTAQPNNVPIVVNVLRHAMRPTQTAGRRKVTVKT